MREDERIFTEKQKIKEKSNVIITGMHNEKRKQGQITPYACKVGYNEGREKWFL